MRRVCGMVALACAAAGLHCVPSGVLSAENTPTLRGQHLECSDQATECAASCWCCCSVRTFVCLAAVLACHSHTDLPPCSVRGRFSRVLSKKQIARLHALAAPFKVDLGAFLGHLQGVGRRVGSGTADAPGCGTLAILHIISWSG